MCMYINFPRFFEAISELDLTERLRHAVPQKFDVVHIRRKETSFRQEKNELEGCDWRSRDLQRLTANPHIMATIKPTGDNAKTKTHLTQGTQLSTKRIIPVGTGIRKAHYIGRTQPHPRK